MNIHVTEGDVIRPLDVTLPGTLAAAGWHQGIYLRRG
jgi:hypothetical protein